MDVDTLPFFPHNFQFRFQPIDLHLQFDQFVRDGVRYVDVIHQRFVSHAFILDPYDPSRNTDDR